jgi:D-alanyl-D-alanine carboxypeptidase
VRKLLQNSGAALAGALLGALLMLAGDGLSLPVFEPPATGEPPRPSRSAPAALLAWTVGGLPRGSEKAIEKVPSVLQATTVEAGLDWMRASRAVDGGLLERPKEGRMVPIEAALIEPREYARLVPVSERQLVLGLRQRELLMAATEARLRGGGSGTRLRLSDGWMRAAGVISDAATNGYEVLMPRPAPSSWRDSDRFVLALVSSCSRAAIRQHLKPLLAPGSSVRIRCGREQPFLRYGDSVLPQLVIKEAFGEFSARPLEDGTIDIDPVWRRRHIVTAKVPLLHRVTCHRALLPQLRGALGELEERGLGHVIDPAQYAGCFAPRFISRDPDGRLSHHSWGIAIDVNALENTFGSKADQDQRLIAVMEGWGFTWGGGWLVPDPMHFEWLRWP